MTERVANVIGLGLIGGSIAKALVARGWVVWGDDNDAQRVAQAVELDVISQGELCPDAYVTFVAVPVLGVVAAVSEALARTSGFVTDVASVKGSIAAAHNDPRFIPGHPMAGSELDGLSGADPEMFTGAVWVLTPTPSTSDATFSAVASVVASLGAEVVVVGPDRHDELVAIVSHVPHLTAATMMNMANAGADDHAALLRLAAGGFRDMTRIASGSPAIWLDICTENRAAIVQGLDSLVAGLIETRRVVADGDLEALERQLAGARQARTNLPVRGGRLVDATEVRIPIADRAGAAAEIFTLAAELGVNIADFEVFHSAEGDRGVLILMIERAQTDLFRGGLVARGYRPSMRKLD